jgi:hypothetical protein
MYCHELVFAHFSILLDSHARPMNDAIIARSIATITATASHPWSLILLLN